MKIAYLLSEYPALHHAYLLREVRALRALGWDVQTISIRNPENWSVAFSAEEREEWQSTRYVLASGPLGLLKANLLTVCSRPARYARGLATAWDSAGFRPSQLVRATAYFIEAVTAGFWLQKAEVAHVHSVYTSTIAWIMTQVFDLPVSLAIHGSAEFVDPVGFRIREKVHAAQLVCAISYFGKSQLMHWSASSDWPKLEVTPLGVEVERWKPAEFRERPAPFELLTVGRIADAKGYPILMEALSRLVEAGRNVHLTLVGDGEGRAELQQRASQFGIADRVTFAGWKSQEELRELYGKSDLCVLSSFAEGIPVVLMEAMAAGVPCVAPRITGIPELIGDGQEGLLFTPSRTDELVSAIARLMDDTELRRRMATASRARIAADYDLQKNALHLSEVFTRRISPKNALSAVSR